MMSSPPARHLFGPYRRSPTSAILVVVFVVLFISGMSSLLLFKCYMRRRQRRRRQTDTSLSASDSSSSGNRHTGLESTTLAAFPTLVYANVKHLRRENLDLECAICLSEFQDDSVLRLLTICYHVFHQDCVDVWLQDHTSCPVCRAHLDLPPEKIKERFPEVLISGDVSADTLEGSASAEMSEDAVSVEISCNDDQKEKAKMWSGEQPAPPRAAEWYPRWHSTGHSIVGRNRSGSECRFTLRLPENVEATGHGGGGSIDSGGGGDRRTE